MKILLLFLVVATLALLGCPALSLHPLYTDADAVLVPELEGTWGTPRPSDKEEISFRKSDNYQYGMSVFHPDTKVKENYSVRLARIEGQLYMDVIADGQSIGDMTLDTPIGLVPTHVILKVRISGDDFEYSTWEDDAIRKQGTGAAGLDYQVVEGATLVTTSTDGLRRYISSLSPDAFSKSELLKRRGKAAARP